MSHHPTCRGCQAPMLRSRPHKHCGLCIAEWIGDAARISRRGSAFRRLVALGFPAARISRAVQATRKGVDPGSLLPVLEAEDEPMELVT